MRMLLLLLLSALSATSAFSVASGVRQPAATRHRLLASPVLQEYSTKVKLQAEAKSPFRSARILFIFPATIAGASIVGGVGLAVALLLASMKPPALA